MSACHHLISRNRRILLIVFNFKLNLFVNIFIEIIFWFYFQCQNNCDELGAADRVERERLEQLVQEGLKMKAELASKGNFFCFDFILVAFKCWSNISFGFDWKRAVNKSFLRVLNSYEIWKMCSKTYFQSQFSLPNLIWVSIIYFIFETNESK